MRALALVSMLLISAAAWACPTCGAQTDTKGTYQAMTMVMSLLPLAMMGGVVGLIAYRARRADRSSLPPAPPQ